MLSTYPATFALIHAFEGGQNARAVVLTPIRIRNRPTTVRQYFLQDERGSSNLINLIPEEDLVRNELGEIVHVPTRSWKYSNMSRNRLPESL